MLFNHPMPDPDLLLSLYRDVEDPSYLEETGARERTFARSLRQLHGFAGPPGALLDVGCYTGVFLQLAKDAGWITEGIELSSWAAEIARSRGIGEIHEHPLDEIFLGEGRFSAVTWWDVMEHLPRPAEILQAAHRCLSPNGVIAFSTHVVDSIAVKVMGTRYPFFMDMHVVHFSRKTLRRLLEQEGFRVLAIRPHRRILRVSYLLEKIRHKIPTSAAREVIKRIADHPSISGRYVTIGGVGLANVFGQKTG